MFTPTTESLCWGHVVVAQWEVLVLLITTAQPFSKLQTLSSKGLVFKGWATMERQ